MKVALKEVDVIGKRICEIYYKEIVNEYDREDRDVVVKIGGGLFFSLFDVRYPDPREKVRLHKLEHQTDFKKISEGDRDSCVGIQIKSFVYCSALDTEFGLLLEDGTVLSIGVSEYGSFLDIRTSEDLSDATIVDLVLEP